MSAWRSMSNCSITNAGRQPASSARLRMAVRWRWCSALSCTSPSSASVWPCRRCSQSWRGGSPCVSHVQPAPPCNAKVPSSAAEKRRRCGPMAVSAGGSGVGDKSGGGSCWNENTLRLCGAGARTFSRTRVPVTFDSPGCSQKAPRHRAGAGGPGCVLRPTLAGYPPWAGSFHASTPPVPGIRLRATANGACERTPSHLPPAPKVTRHEVPRQSGSEGTSPSALLIPGTGTRTRRDSRHARHTCWSSAAAEGRPLQWRVVLGRTVFMLRN